MTHHPSPVRIAAMILGIAFGLLPCRAPAEEPAAAAVRLEEGDWAAVRRRVAAQRGKVVVVALWTTTCPVCLEEFPALLKLRRTFGRERVALIAVNCDYDGIAGKPPAFYRPRVLKFLTGQRADIENVLLNVAFLDLLTRLDLASTPAVLVYNPDGKLVRRFDNDEAASSAEEFSMDDVARCVANLCPGERGASAP